MEIGIHIKELRMKNGLSQEDLALKIFVSRQSISNWENDKTYPDLKSLLLLSSLFDVSLDSLVKGDIVKMKEFINENDVREFNKASNIFGCLFFSMMITPIPLEYFFSNAGIAIWGLIVLATVIYGFKIEKLKSKHNINTYKEIVAFSENKPLDYETKLIEKGKRKYQKIFYVLISAALAIVISFVLDYTISYLFS